MVTLETTALFDRQLKALTKRYVSIADDLDELKASLQQSPTFGTDLGNGLRKVRMAIKSKGKGKSGGARVITSTAIISVTDTTVYLLTIYDKSDIASLNTSFLKKMKEALRL